MALINVVRVTIIVTILNLKFSTVESAVITRNDDILNSHGGLCLTADCVKQAAFFLNNMDQNVDPCDDFYKYTCGNFIKKTLVPQHKSSVGSFASMEDSLTNDLLDGLQTEIQSDDLDAFKKMKIHYQNCMNESRIEKYGIEPYLDILKKLGGWPVLMGNSWNEDGYKWDDVFLKLQLLGFTNGFPFYLSVGANSKNKTQNIFYLYPSIITIFNATELYLENNKTFNMYHDYMLDVALMLGANKTTAFQEVKDWLEFEMKLLEIETPIEEIRKNSSSKQQKTILELTEQFPSIHWLELLNKIFSSANETIHENDLIEIFDINYIIKLEDLLNKTSKRILANYQIWQVLNRAVPFMPKKFSARKITYYNLLRGVTINVDREMGCYYAVKTGFPIAISGLYVRKYFDQDVKKKITQMSSDIKNQFIENFKNNWRSHQNTTEEILEKINSMNMSVAYPEELLDDKKLEEYYENLQVDSGLYLNSALNMSLFNRQKLYNNFRKPIDRNSWVRHAFVAFVNAYYNGENEIGLPAGILHKPFVYSHGPEYLNYGAIGSIIAHEITHGLYRSGKENNELNTTSRKNDTNIKNFDQCLIDKYNNYNISEGIAVNGSKTLNENIPDITGLKIAYQVYNKWTKNKDIVELNLPGLNHTPLQMFWISAASTFCKKTKTKFLKQQVQWDPHSPSEARVNVAFSNINEFSKDFKCKEGSRMNPGKKCDLW